MRKLVLTGLALLAPSFLCAQTAVRMPGGSPTIGNLGTLPDGTRLPIQQTTSVDANGTPIGTAANPLNVTSSGGSSGNSTDVQGNGTLALATANATYTIPLSGGRNAVGLTITGLTGSGATITVERSNNGGTIWTNANTTESSATGSLSATITADGQARVGVAGATNIRLRVSTAGTGTATIAYDATTAAGPVFFTGYLPSYSTPDGRIIGGVDNRFLNGTAISTGAGATDAGTQRVTLASDGTQATASNQTSGAQVSRVTSQSATGLPNTVAAGTQVPLWLGQRGQIIPGSYAAGFQDGTISNGAMGAEVTQSDQVVGHAVIPNYMDFAAGTARVARGDSVGQFMVVEPSATASAGAAYTAVQGATSIVLKNAPGNLFGINLVNSTVAGFVIAYNGTAAPASGTALTAANAAYCYQVAASTTLDKVFPVPASFTTGITLLMSTSCTTYTPVGTAPILFSGQVK